VDAIFGSTYSHLVMTPPRGERKTLTNDGIIMLSHPLAHSLLLRGC
jgi:hypothetical protein